MAHKLFSAYISLRPKNKKINVLCVILFFSLLICFSLPHKYNPVIRFSSQRSSTVISSNSDTTQEEKYLAYLPHSGLSNQRIELANALLLAHMLNRTLIIPPAFLGAVFGWMPREALTERLEWLTTPKNFDKICQLPTPGRISSYLQRSRCDEYRNFGMIPWQELHDFQPLIDAGLKIKFQSIVSMAQLTKDLQLTHHNDIYMHKDAQLYDWRLYENKTHANELLQNKLNYFQSFGGKRIFKVLIPSHFNQRKEKLLYLGGVFGSTRLSVVSPKYKAMQKKIANVLHYRLDTPLGETVKSIVDYLGGKGAFMSVHFRTGDKPFKNEIKANLSNFVKNMTDIIGDRESDSCINIQPQDDVASLGNHVRIYVATDHRDPRGEDSRLLPWFDRFPCTLTLPEIPHHLFRPLDELRDSGTPSKPLKKFLIPLVDAMVAAHGYQILTTPRSTFSRYIEELHNAWI